MDILIFFPFIFLVSSILVGLLKHKDGSILKPLLSSDERTLREHKFYEDVFRAEEPQPELLTLRTFLPKYLGTWKTDYLGQGIGILFDYMDMLAILLS